MAGCANLRDSYCTGPQYLIGRRIKTERLQRNCGRTVLDGGWSGSKLSRYKAAWSAMKHAVSDQARFVPCRSPRVS